MIKRQSAFSLVELMVVVGIMMIMTTLGIASYINTQDRTRVSNAGKELLAYFRKLQSYAKVGDRGPAGNPCNSSAAATKLERWQTKLTLNTQHADPAAVSKIICYSGKRTLMSATPAPMPTPPATDAQKYTFSLPKIGGAQLRAYEIDASGTLGSEIDCVFFESVFGETSVGRNTGSDCETKLFDLETSGSQLTDRKRNARFIVDDGQFGYTFLLTNGAFSTGCVCDPNSSGAADSCDNIQC